MSEQIQTAGPADPKAPGYAKLYAILAVVGPLVSGLATFGILSNDQAGAVNGALTALLGLLSAFGFGVAAKRTSTQVNNGTFDKAPELPAVSALEQLKILRDQAGAEVDRAVANVQSGADLIASATTTVLNAIPGASGVVQDLLDDVRRRG
jgi:hypothetical protein